MTIRAKTLVVVGVTLLGLVVAFYAASSTIMRRSTAEAEDQDIRHAVKGVLGVLAQTVEQFDTRFADWSAWDDAYAFVQDGNAPFIKSNLVDASLSTLKVSLL